MKVKVNLDIWTEFDHKPWLPWFDHFEIELALVAGNDVKFVTVVQPTLLLWSLWFQDGGVSNFAGSCIFNSCDSEFALDYLK
jgi:hypothetical protein